MTIPKSEPLRSIHAPEAGLGSVTLEVAAEPRPTAIQLLSSSSLPMLLQEEFERLIMTGELAPGARLNETELSERFGTSRGPVREALRALEEAGLVKNEKNRGSFVRIIALEEAQEIYELREALETVVGKRAALRATDEFVGKLTGIVEAMQQAVEQQNSAEYAALNLQFHTAILMQAGSKKLTEMYTRLVKQLSLFRMKALTAGGALSISVTEHREILSAIARRNPLRAGRAMSEHVSISRSRMLKAYEAEHPESTPAG